MAENLQKALEAFRKRQAEVAASTANAPPKKKVKREPGREAKPGRGRGRGRGASAAHPAAGDADKPLSGKEAVQQSVLKSNVPLSKQIKDVLDHLLAVRPAAMSAADIRERFGHDASPRGVLYKALSSNTKVEVTPQGDFFYKAEHELSNAAQLLAFLQRAPDGTFSTLLKDAYPAAMADIAHLHKEQKLWGLASVDTGELVLYPREDPPLIATTPDVAALWHEVQVPEDPEALEEELRRAGIQPAPKSGPRRRAPKPVKAKAKRAYRPRNVTNVHMPELFRDAAPAQID